MIDRVEIYVKAGDGGNGAVSFRREKYVPFGGPDGGNGGKGGDILVAADRQLSTLHSLSRSRYWKADKGGNGAGKKMQGKNGQELVIKVPPGTLIFKKTDGEKALIADLLEEGQVALVVRGGQGGFGNDHFATATSQAPRIAQKGEVGEEAWLILDLKLIADVGIIGYPNVGKSTLLASASAARPKIADYPFTTTEPNLGVVEVANSTFVLAEIPGLIEGAHRGSGLGHYFLRHAERTKLLIHLLDGSSKSPLDDLNSVNKELALFNPLLGERPQIVVVNKIDLPDVESRIPKMKKELGLIGVPVFFISAATRKGVPQLMANAKEMLDSLVSEKPQEAPALFQPKPRKHIVTVSKEGDTFVVSSPEAERLIARMDLTSSEARSYLRRQFARMGVARALKRAGVKPGDAVRFGEVGMEWE
ncbi:MAG: GTPase ObgE [Dehalococcoidia bacterium]